MALQTSIAQYFNSRKRRAVDEIKKVSNTNKVLILDKNESDVSDISEATLFDEEGAAPTKKIIYNDSPKVIQPRKVIASAPKLQRKTPKSALSHKKLQQKSNLKQSDIRKSLLSSFNASLEQTALESSENVHDLKKSEESAPALVEQVNVPFEIKGPISPKKATKTELQGSLDTLSSSGPSQSSPQDIYNTPKKGTSNTFLTPLEKTPVKDSILELKKKLIKSSRLDEIRSALNKLNDGHQKLKEIEAKYSSKSPSLKKFKTIEIEYTSPTKACRSADIIREKTCDSPSLLKRSLLMSPGKSDTSRAQSMVTLSMSPGKAEPARKPFVSPRKLFTESSPVKPAAFERNASLVARGKPSLVLPFKYISLAEAFRDVDTVVSMLFNRNETIFFSKLKSSYQQMTKKNISESLLAQIHSICPDLFLFKQEKLRQVPGRVDKYELVVVPVVNNSNGGNEDNKESNRTLMTPSVLLERKRKLYKALLEKTKDYHQVFLLALNPPIHLDRNKLSRWHPEFDVDGVPDITPAALPKPPNVETFSSAKDVLTKARDMFICNPRMEKALERVSSETQSTTLASASIPALKNALKGIPSSILEKVRAKQAAKLAESLTRNPQEGKKRIEYSRLPEIARIVRNTFVGEKKNVLPKTFLLTKLNDSFREVLTPSDMEHHLKLVMECTSGWLTAVDCRKEIFYKLNKQTEMTKVLNQIQNAINNL